MPEVLYYFLAAAIVSALILWLIWSYQRSILFRPWKFLIDPRLCAVDGVDLVDLHPSDEEKLYAWHRAPKVAGAPVIVYFDGNRGNISIWNRRWRRIAAAGAGFIAVSYRGYGGSTQQPSEQGLHEDAHFAWQWALQYYPESQLAIHGFSLGTGVAAKLGSIVKTSPVILEAPYTSTVGRAREMMPVLPVSWLMRDTFRNRDWVGNIEAPLLIAHGDRDRIVPIRHGKKLYRLARQPKKFVKFKGSNHLTMPSNGLYPVIWDFLDYVPPGEYAERAYAEEQEWTAEGWVQPLAAALPESAVASEKNLFTEQKNEVGVMRRRARPLHRRFIP